MGLRPSVIAAMHKYNVVLDTNIYRKNPSRSDLPFQALERLCRANIVKLHLPYVVEREFQTQQVEIYRKEFEKASSAIDSILRKGLSAVHASRVEAIRNELANATQPILSDVEAVIRVWAESIGAKFHPITEQQTLAAMESYFLGEPPLKAPKNREDIPDAFIFQTILAISADATPLVVVAEDEKIAQASESIPGGTTHRSLSSFIESAPIQAEILELDVIDNLATIASEIQKYEEMSNELSAYIRNKAGDKLVGKTIHSLSIPDDNNEATIESYNDPDDIEFDFNDLYYFGNGEFGLPFTFIAEVSAFYYIFKSDYYCLDEKKMPSVSDHNDHYFEAEENFEVNVFGLMKLSIDSSILKNISAESLEEHLTLEIDSIEVIGIIE